MICLHCFKISFCPVNVRRFGCLHRFYVNWFVSPWTKPVANSEMSKQSIGPLFANLFMHPCCSTANTQRASAQRASVRSGSARSGPARKASAQQASAQQASAQRASGQHADCTCNRHLFSESILRYLFNLWLSNTSNRIMTTAEAKPTCKSPNHFFLVWIIFSD